jgi:ABC-type transport system involved in multi-copper enzyme maturation permease subunit
MSAPAIAPYRSASPDRHDGFAQLLHAEWTKFRTVRGWVIAMIVAVLLPGLLGLLNHDNCSNGNNTACTLPLGPGGEAVVDSFYLVHQPLAGNGSITVQMTSLTGQIMNAPSSGHVAAGTGGGPATPNLYRGLEPWSKAGIIIKANTSQGSPYAAMMVTGRHGVRMQYNYTGDVAGLPGTVAAAVPRWLRLTRAGDTITGYDSADGTHWTKVGTATLPGMPSTVQAGLFAASPRDVQGGSQTLGGPNGSSVGPSMATGAFDHVGLQGRWPAGAWRGEDVGADAEYPLLPGGYHQAGDGYAVTGSGDIAPDVPGGAPGGGISVSQTLTGAFAGLIVMIVVGTMFITAEYRRGLIRTTLTASPRRGQVLAAKAIVLAAVTFVAGVVAVAGAVFLGERAIRADGSFVDPVSALTEVRLVAGMAALLAVAAVLALAIGTILRRSVGAVAAVIVVILLPYLLAVVPSVLPASVAAWLLRLTPAAGFAVERAYPVYPQVNATYTASSGYYPLVPWAGFAVLCGYAAVALGVAVFLLRRRDA